MAAESDPLAEGFQAGFERAFGEGLETPFDQVEEVPGMLRDVIGPEAADLHPRFVSLFAEHVAIASVARSVYGEDPLSFAMISDYLSAARQFFNSFVHP